MLAKWLRTWGVIRNPYKIMIVPDITENDTSGTAGQQPKTAYYRG
jgi:hypothetical protein